MKKLGLVAATAFAAALLATPAQAAVITANSITFFASDIGAGPGFSVNFNGNVNETPIAGLTAKVTFDLTSYSTSQAIFSVKVENTSTSPITASRISGVAFNTNPNLLGGATNSAILDEFVLNDPLPNQVGLREGCASSHQNQCGASGDGVQIGQTHAFNLTLNFGADALGVNGLVLSDFAVRYQSIAGTNRGSSGTGLGTPDLPSYCTSTANCQDVPPTPTPEPATLALLGLGLLGAGVARRRKQ